MTMQGRSPEDVAFICARVLADIAERPSIRPYLGEEDRGKPGRKPETDATVLVERRRHAAERKRAWREQRNGRATA